MRYLGLTSLVLLSSLILVSCIIETGEIGPQGAVGIPGPLGSIGTLGMTGPDGDRGDIGAQGELGIRGKIGDKGIIGEIGPEGPTGIPGMQGTTGKPGEMGVQGEQGIKGGIGVTGPAGTKGAEGWGGPQGAPGSKGGQGDLGTPGFATKRAIPKDNTTITLDNNGSVGRYPAVTVGQDGFGLISYYDQTNTALKLIHCANITCTLKDSSVVLDNAGAVGQYSSITIGTDGYGLVSYYDETNSGLKSVHCKNVACTLTDTPVSLDTGGLVGKYSSIAIGGDGLALITYYDESNKRFTYLHCRDVSCTSSDNKTQPDVATATGQHTSIATGSDSLALMTYYDETQTALKISHCRTLDCATVTQIIADNSGAVGEYSSITIGTDGLGLVSYYDATNTALKVVHCRNVSCSAVDTPVTLDSDGNVGEGTSITIGADGFPLISYYDTTNGDLKLARCIDSVCSSADLFSLDVLGDIGGNSSITVGVDALALIGYFDASNGNLKLIHCENVFCSSFFRRR